jgi:hypothetical protein
MGVNLGFALCDGRILADTLSKEIYLTVKDQFGDLVIDGRIILKCIFGGYKVRSCGLDLVESVYEDVSKSFRTES